MKTKIQSLLPGFCKLCKLIKCVLPGFKKPETKPKTIPEILPGFTAKDK